MSGASEFRPDWLSAPGDTIADALKEQRISVAQFAASVDLPLAEARRLLRGECKITIGLARRLTHAVGGSVEFWISRDAQFQQQHSRIKPLEKDDWLRQVPMADMVKFGWLPSVPAGEVLSACLEYFGVPSITAWYQAYRTLERQVAFRTSPALEAKPVAVAAWLRRGEIEAEQIRCREWNLDRFEQSLTSIRRLTMEKNPRKFIPELQRIASEGGVAVVVVRAPAGCRASGATRFLDSGKALLMLSARYLSDDQFWFSFFHEAGHLVLHAHTDLILEGVDPEEIDREREANDFAENVLMPKELADAFAAVPLRTNDLVRFARRIGTSPGIVVGQLQHSGRIPRNHFNGLKRWYEWE